MTCVFLAGASRGVGRELAQQLIIEKYKVVALLRSNKAETALTSMGVEVVYGDALERESMAELVQASHPDLVVSTIGGLPEDGGVRADYEGNRNLMDAAVKVGAQRFLLISSIGSGRSAQALPPQALETLGPVLAEKEQAEAHLKQCNAQSGLVYTIIRPGSLVSQSATGQEVLTEDVSVAGSIPRAGVARLVVACLKSNRAVNKVFSAVDKSMVRSSCPFEAYEL